MVARIPSTVLIAALCGVLPAEDTPDPLPAVFVAPYSLNLNEFFDKGAQDDNPKMTIYQNGVASTAGAGLTVNLSATADAHWQVLSADRAHALEATTSLGESLIDETPNTGPGMMQVQGFHFNMAAFGNTGQRKGPKLIALTLLAPKHPASSIHKLVAIADLLLAKEDSVKTVKAKLTGDEVDPLGLSNCDITIKKNDGTVTVSLGEGADDIIRSMSFLDDAGNSFKGMQRGMGFNGKRSSTTYAFANNANITTVAIDYFGEVRKVQATFELDNLPIVGTTTPREQEPKPAVTVNEVKAAAPVTPAAGAANPAAPAAPAPAPGTGPATPKGPTVDPAAPATAPAGQQTQQK